MHAYLPRKLVGKNKDASRDDSYILRSSNVGTGIDQSIKQLAEEVAKTVGIDGSIEWDESMPDGTPKNI